MQFKLFRNVFKIVIVFGFGTLAFSMTIRTQDIRMSGLIVQQPEYVEVDRTGYQPPVIHTPDIKMSGKIVQQPEYVEVDRTGYSPVLIHCGAIQMNGMQQ